MDWKQALSVLIPQTLAAITGGAPGVGGFATGYTRGRGLRDEMQNRQSYLDLAQQRETYNQGRDVIDDQRRAQLDAAAKSQRIMQLLQDQPGWLTAAIEQGMTSGAADPADFGRQQYEDMLNAVQKAIPEVGEHRDALRMAAGDPKSLANTARVRRYAGIYDKMTKDATPEHYEALLQSPRPVVDGMTFKDMDALMQSAGKGWAQAPPKEKTAGSFEDYTTATPERKAQIAADRKTYMQADDRPRITVQTAGGLPTAVQRRVDATSRSYESVAVVKNMQKVAESIEFANQLDPNTKNPADDQALIYNFAKAMDPDSVVREGEYAVVQKYAQSWAEKFGFDVKRLYSNSQFLTPEARANMKATITAKGKAAQNQYGRVRKQYADKINRITGSTDGDEYLIDFGVMMPSGGGKAAPAETPAPGRIYYDASGNPIKRN
jgi:hypothetical protein